MDLGTDEIMYGVDLNWPRDYYFTDLKYILDNEYPGWRPANQCEDFNGQTIHVVMKSVAFASSEDALSFILQYGEKFNATLTRDLSFVIAPF